MVVAAAIDEQGIIDVPNVSVGWVLNNFIWRLMSDGEREKYIAPIVRRLLSDEFLTNVGLRTRALSTIDPISDVIDYHGRETVWPMFTFMVIEGLRRHRMYRLAEQLEIRLINGFNSTAVFPEFHIVDATGVLLVPTQGKHKPVKDVQMKPEHMIGFSVVPALTLAHRIVRPPVHKHSQPWQLALEDELLSSMPVIKLAEPNLAHKFVGDVSPCRLRRWKANLRLFDYLMRHKAVLRNSNR